MRIPNFLKKKIKQQLEISQERKKKKKKNYQDLRETKTILIVQELMSYNWNLKKLLS